MDIRKLNDHIANIGEELTKAAELIREEIEPAQAARNLVPFHTWAAEQSERFKLIADSIDDADDVIPVLRELCESYSTALKVLAVNAADKMK